MPVDFRGKVRDRDPDTSWDAAELQTDQRISAVQAAIVTLLERCPSTDEDLVDTYEAQRFMDPEVPNVTPQSIRSRRNELHIAGRVVDSGIRGRTRTGRKAVVWALATAPHKENGPDAAETASSPISSIETAK